MTIQSTSVVDNALLNAFKIVPVVPTPSPSAPPLAFNFPQIKTGIINYQVGYYPASLQPTVMNWVAHHFDFVIGGSLDPRSYR